MPDLIPAIDVAENLFLSIAAATADPSGSGVSRPSFGDGEQRAHDLVAGVAREHGLEIRVDKVGALHVILAGKDRVAPAVMIGSHLDSVPQGGDFDGTAGVLLGLAVLVGLRRMNIVPPRDIVTVALRAEESTWFNASYIGSRSILGQLPAAEARHIQRSDTGRSLADHMREAGFDPGCLDDPDPAVNPTAIAAFIEPHIEQGPILVDRAKPVGLVTGIRGSFRYRAARCHGEYAHSGAAPRLLRRDAVTATAALITELNTVWRDFEAAGEDLVFTVGQMHTDPSADGFSKVSGQTRFSIDVRSLSTQALDRFHQVLLEKARDIGERHNVEFDFGEKTGSAPAVTDADVLDRLTRMAGTLNIDTTTLASGAGHDAAVFASAGVPTAMVFIRNRNGSHNPAEAMEIADFAEAARLVMAFCLE